MPKTRKLRIIFIATLQSIWFATLVTWYPKEIFTWDLFILYLFINLWIISYSKVAFHVKCIIIRGGKRIFRKLRTQGGRKSFNAWQKKWEQLLLLYFFSFWSYWNKKVINFGSLTVLWLWGGIQPSWPNRVKLFILLISTSLDFNYVKPCLDLIQL